jgi:hypothetical protein
MCSLDGSDGEIRSRVRFDTRVAWPRRSLQLTYKKYISTYDAAQRLYFLLPD